jgi:hypothetical protein
MATPAPGNKISMSDILAVVNGGNSRKISFGENMANRLDVYP